MFDCRENDWELCLLIILKCRLIVALACFKFSGFLAYRGAVKLELRCPKKVDGIAVDPEPDWNFSTLLSEINSLEEKLSVSSKFPLAFAKTKSR